MIDGSAEYKESIDILVLLFSTPVYLVENYRLHTIMSSYSASPSNATEASKTDPKARILSKTDPNVALHEDQPGTSVHPDIDRRPCRS